MNRATAERLLDLNRRFYEERGGDFSATRQRLQPGVKRLIERLQGSESILDLGCGNGELARALSRGGYHGSYLGLDSSPVLLAEASSSSFGFPVRLLAADLSQPGWDRGLMPAEAGISSVQEPPFEVIFCFAVLHHLPGAALRSEVLCKIHELLGVEGIFMLSNWRFTHSPRTSRRIQSWNAAGLAREDVEPNDYLLDWKRGGISLRYVHQFEESELRELAAANGFEVTETFYSDGADGQSSIYQVWRKARG